jgi:hypothetical protein
MPSVDPAGARPTGHATNNATVTRSALIDRQHVGASQMVADDAPRARREALANEGPPEPGLLKLPQGEPAAGKWHRATGAPPPKPMAAADEPRWTSKRTMQR